MFHRLYTFAVIFCWLASMGWLVGSKIVPSMLPGDPPDYNARLESEETAPDAWRIKWEDRLIGYATSDVIHGEDGQAEVRSIVQFTDLPLSAMTRQFLGVMSALAEPLLPKNLNVEMLVTTKLCFSSAGALEHVDTVVDVGDLERLARIVGVVEEDNQLRVEAHVGGDTSRRPLRQKIALPANATLKDALSPRSQVRQLRVGQQWTMPVYRGFPPNQPVQIIQATVERHEVIVWDGSDVETLLVVYRADPSQIQAANEPVGREWVRRDGWVLRQEVSFAGLNMLFERIGDEPLDKRTDLLNDPQVWERHTEDAP